ncbi:MAG: DEAD/DEAH box helicase family protein [Caldilineaceae bacterium]|nr:DEAD/DEAH box helicase family protein [Caldilineaceae bacterium]
MNLYPFQLKAVDALRRNIKKGVRRQILCSPTGSGKTVCAMEIVRSAQMKGKRSIFVCDRQTLVNQTSQRFDQFGILHGVTMGDYTRGRSNNTQVASAQTLEKRKFWYTGDRKPDLVVIDECHEIRKGIVEYVKEHNLVTIGMSATPLTPGLADIYEDVVNVTSTVQLIKEEYLAPLHVVAAQAEVDVDGVKVTSTGEWDREQLSDRVRFIVGDVVAEWEHHTTEQFGGPEKTIVFGASVADCEDLARQFQEAGYDFRVLHYRQSVEEKQEIISNFERGLHLGLISCVILTKGFDVPSVRCMVDAYPLRKSLAMHIQKLGRVMRTATGKSHGLLIDHAGNYYGFMDQANRFFQEGVSVLPTTKPKARKSKPRFQSDSKCKSCGYVYQVLDPREARPTHCPACGAPRQSFGRPKMTVMPGKLEEIAKVDGDLADGIFDGSVDLWTEISCNAMLVAGGEYDKARRIAYAQFKGVTGAWPRGEFMPPDRAPITAVRDLCLREYRRWKRQRKVA